ncbi:MAG: hypothetical protein J5I93_03175 [Pirellulaceae bacterium]|nr:hypothetical protein [Pirellulaceae bacterium]
MQTGCETHDSKAAYEAGRRAGLGVAALAASLVAFVSLLGVEKSLLALVLGLMAWRGAMRGSAASKLGLVAMLISAAHVLTVVIVLFVFWDRLLEFVRTLEQLS